MLTLAFTATRPQAVGCLKMADERTKAPYNQQSPVPEQYGWPSLIKKDGDELFDHYRHTLEALLLRIINPKGNRVKGTFPARAMAAKYSCYAGHRRHIS